MNETNQPYSYRQQIYDRYVSQKVRPDGASYVQQDYDSWSAAANIRVRGWLPLDLQTPILDAGCGSGNFLYLLQQIGYSNIAGVDLSPEQIYLAKKWCTKAEIIQGNALEILAGYEDELGLITGFDIIEHLGKAEQLQFLKVAARALRSGGRLILQTPNAESPWMGSVAYGDFTHEWFFTPTSMADLLRQAGLVNYQARGSDPYIHGPKSLVRAILWKVIKNFLKVWNIAETGSPGSGIYTRVFLATAVKS